ncbi:MAG: DUF4242 domain-containing protein, partial [Geopsychrobacter sp.]|nr:DUF4242 domain-containing protein [Geopsychrobacter sp.]
MPKYIIEREIPQAGNLSIEELQSISQKSCGVLQQMGPQIQWVQSYVTADKIYCVYIAPNEKLVREHAEQGGFPANSIAAVTSIIDPTTAEYVFAQLKEKGLHVADEVYPHVYPHCWRTGDELVFRLVDEWFINMDWRDEIKEVTQQIDWLPKSIDGQKHELEWLSNMRDW